MTKIKKDIITKAKVKKKYAKVKAEYQQHHPSALALPIPAEEQEQQPRNAATREDGQQSERIGSGEDANPQPSAPQIHPSRQAMLNPSADVDSNSDDNHKEEQRQKETRDQRRDRNHSRRRRPDYYAKELAVAERNKAKVEAKVAERARREEERARRLKERELFNLRMAKAKLPGRDGKLKLGRQGSLLLDKVKRLVES